MGTAPRMLHRMYRDGYVVARNLVPRSSVASLVRAINHDLGCRGVHPDAIEDYRQDSYCPSLREDESVLEIVNSRAMLAVAESFLGPGNVLPATRIQFALRFPEQPGESTHDAVGHIDGIGTGTNGIPAGAYRRGFAMICVILLSDLPRLDMGNFFVRAGSYLRVAEFLAWRQRACRDSAELEDDGFPGPTQVLGRAGDVVFAHALCVHGAAANLAEFIRYALVVCFRHRNRAFAVDGTPALLATLDPWREWEGFGGNSAFPGRPATVDRAAARVNRRRAPWLSSCRTSARVSGAQKA